MNLVLIGFSGAGKSYWALRLETELGYRRVCCDDRIRARLAARTGRPLDDMAGFTAWLGRPYEPGYRERETLHLACEAEVMTELLDRPAGERTVIDTSGSVVYLPETLVGRLGELGTVVYIEPSPADLETMFRVYLDDPKPVIWGDVYRRRPGQDEREALRERYPELVRWRHARYEKLAEARLGYRALRAPGMGPRRLLAAVRAQLG